jgi:hypothetical protein
MLAIPENILSPAWDQAIELLAAEIKVRHYSRKTLKTYADWARKLQRYLTDKPPVELTALDVKEYLTHLAVGCAGVFLVDSLEKKYPAAARDFIWQWFFPQKELTLMPGTKKHRRYHLHESQVQEALKNAARRASLTKRVKSILFGTVCHPSFTGELRHTDDSDNAWEHRCENDDDLYPLYTG